MERLRSPVEEIVKRNVLVAPPGGRDQLVRNMRPRVVGAVAVAFAAVLVAAVLLAARSPAHVGGIESKSLDSAAARYMTHGTAAVGYHFTFVPGREAHPPPPRWRLRSRITFCPILMYHYIRVDSDPADTLGINLSVAPPTFGAEMQYLFRHHFHTVTVARLADHIRYGVPLPSKPVALTFDDGYEDQFMNALPVLERYHFTATFFIVSGFVNTPRYMSWRQIRALDRLGMEIGVHTIHHLDLTTLPPTQMWAEVYDSKMTIEAHIHHPADVFAYPSGAFDPQVLGDVHRAGYLAAVSTLPGDLHAQQSLFYLFRVRVLNSDTPRTLGVDVSNEFGDPFEPSPSYP